MNTVKGVNFQIPNFHVHLSSNLSEKTYLLETWAFFYHQPLHNLRLVLHRTKTQWPSEAVLNVLWPFTPAYGNLERCQWKLVGKENEDDWVVNPCPCRVCPFLSKRFKDRIGLVATRSFNYFWQQDMEWFNDKEVTRISRHWRTAPVRRLHLKPTCVSEFLYLANENNQSSCHWMLFHFVSDIRAQLSKMGVLIRGMNSVISLGWERDTRKVRRATHSGTSVWAEQGNTADCQLGNQMSQRKPMFKTALST